MLKLREIKASDLEEINKWRNDPKLISALGAPYRYINMETDEKWYRDYMSNRSTNVRCAIVEDKDDKILGMVSLTTINSLNQSAVFHIMIGDPENQGKGIGTFAANKILEHGFLNLNLHRIELTTLESNKGAQGLYEKCGFTKEGCKRSAIYKNGAFEDEYMYSIIKEEFLKHNLAESKG